MLTGGFTILKQNSLVKLAGIGGGVDCISWTSKCRGFWSPSGRPAHPATSCGAGQDPTGTLLLGGGSAGSPASPGRPLPVPRHAQRLQKRSFVQGQPLCVTTGPRLCPAGCGPQNRRPLRSVPSDPRLCFRNAAGPSQNSRPQVDSLGSCLSVNLLNLSKRKCQCLLAFCWPHCPA